VVVGRVLSDLGGLLGISAPPSAVALSGYSGREDVCEDSSECHDFSLFYIASTLCVVVISRAVDVWR